MTKFQAIETKYNGYKFRSRLEARWAKFFDALGVKYEYEPEGVDLYYNGKYLPDFRLFGKYYLEVKSQWYNLGEDGWREQCKAITKVVELSMMVKENACIVFGNDPLDYFVQIYDDGIRVSSESGDFLYADIETEVIVWDDENSYRAEGIEAREARFEFGETPKVVNGNGHSEPDFITRVIRENKMVNYSEDIEWAFEYLKTQKNLLSQNNIDFIHSLERGYRDYGTLTERQFDALVKKVEYVNWQLGSDSIPGVVAWG